MNMKYWKKICTDFYSEYKRRPNWRELAERIGNCDDEMLRNFAKKEATKSRGAMFYFKLIEQATNGRGGSIVGGIEV